MARQMPKMLAAQPLDERVGLLAETSKAMGRQISRLGPEEVWAWAWSEERPPNASAVSGPSCPAVWLPAAQNVPGRRERACVPVEGVMARQELGARHVARAPVWPPAAEDSAARRAWGV